MNKKSLYLVIILLLFKMTAFSKNVEDLVITDATIQKEGSNVNIKFKLDMTDLDGKLEFVFIPVIFNGDERLELERIIAMSYNRDMINARTGSNEHYSPREVSFIDEIKNYSVKVPYEDWMYNLSLKFEIYIKDYKKETILDPIELVKNQILGEAVAEPEPEPEPIIVIVKEEPVPVPIIVEEEPEPVPVLIIVEEEPEPIIVLDHDMMSHLERLLAFDRESKFLYHKNDSNNIYNVLKTIRVNQTLKVYFGRGSAIIDPTYHTNYKTLETIDKMIQLIKAVPTAKLTKIVVVGLASPEGLLSYNIKLADKRAQALKGYVGQKVPYDPKLFEIVNGGENWDGLKRMVENSKMPNRWDVLDIINNYTVLEGREGELMRLNGGIPYRYMAKNFFPKLRNGGYVQIYYEY